MRTGGMLGARRSQVTIDLEDLDNDLIRVHSNAMTRNGLMTDAPHATDDALMSADCAPFAGGRKISFREEAAAVAHFDPSASAQGSDVSDRYALLRLELDICRGLPSILCKR